MDKKRRLFIEKMADSVRDECNITGYGIQNIFEATGNRLGYRVIRYPIGENSFMGIALIKDTEKIIFLNSSIILSREIFSIAHEIGHHKLHLSELEKTIIKDDDFSDRNELEIEANYFAASLLMPREKVEKFARLELEDKDVNKWTGLDIARIQTEFNVSYDMVLIRLKDIGILNDRIINQLKVEKVERTIPGLLNAIGGNINLCKPATVKVVPADYLEWVISNYNDKLIPINSVQNAVKYLDLDSKDLVKPQQDEVEDDESLDDLIGRME